jgi:5-formyltetrahydrofolate cyclo-ligase
MPQSSSDTHQNISAEKKYLRSEAAIRRNLLSYEHIPVRSFEKLKAAPWFQKARTVSLYVSQIFEFPTKGLFELCVQEKKIVCVPIIQGKTLAFQKITNWGQFVVNEKNIRESLFGTRISPDRVDVFFVPLVAFDQSGNRLGRGGGYFDRLFSNQNLLGVKVGVGFDHQECFRVPAEDHDIPMEYILTENRVIQTL